jgi:hypothetical protein
MIVKNMIYTSEDLKPHPIGGAMVQTVTSNLVEDSSAMWIEIFNGVKIKYLVINGEKEKTRIPRI